MLTNLHCMRPSVHDADLCNTWASRCYMEFCDLEPIEIIVPATSPEWHLAWAMVPIPLDANHNVNTDRSYAFTWSNVYKMAFCILNNVNLKCSVYNLPVYKYQCSPDLCSTVQIWKSKTAEMVYCILGGSLYNSCLCPFWHSWCQETEMCCARCWIWKMSLTLKNIAHFGVYSIVFQHLEVYEAIHHAVPIIDWLSMQFQL